MYISINVETGTKWEEIVSIGAILFSGTGNPIKTFYTSLPSIDSMLREFAVWYLQQNDFSTTHIIWCRGHLAEASAFKLMLEKGLIEAKHIPETPIEVTSMLLMSGEPTAIASYIRIYDIAVPRYEETALQDCADNAAVFFDLMKKAYRRT